MLWAEQVADFGLSRHNPNKHTVATRTCGGVTHAAPELIREGRLSPATGMASAPDQDTIAESQWQACCQLPMSGKASKRSEPLQNPAMLAMQGSTNAHTLVSIFLRTQMCLHLACCWRSCWLGSLPGRPSSHMRRSLQQCSAASARSCRLLRRQR